MDVDVQIPGPSYFMPLDTEAVPGSSNSIRKRNEKDDLTSATDPKRPRTVLNLGEFPDADEEEDIFRTETANFSDDDDLIMFDVFPEPPPPPVVVKYRQVLRNKPDIPYVPISTSDGSRVYLRIFPEKQVDVKAVQHKKYNLLGVKFQDLRKQSQISKNRFHETLAQVVDTESLGFGVADDLWVEKYKPKSYMDLLSEETLNHNLLHWIKLWDKTVFGNDYLQKYKETKEKYSKLEAKEKEKEESKFGYRPTPNLVEDDTYDESGFPKQKVALLHGPPGLGKTTCAHIVAKHAGYKVLEMNASDDRSVEIFRKTLDTALLNRAEVFQDGRPNCLIIDEIDGAPADAINVLIELITGKATEKGKKKVKKILRRPIICICNDLYAVSLRNLKPLAVSLTFPPITPTSLVARLQQVSLREDLSMDSVILRRLAEKTDCDIRSCLSSMQFLKNYHATAGVTNDIFEQVAQKDKHKGIFSVWDDIFKLPQEKRDSDEDGTKPAVRFRNILRTVQSHGDYEKLQSGIFENYLKTKFKDSYFQSITEGLSWLTWFDEIRHKVDKSQNYSLMPYLPFYFVKSHFLYATKNFVKLNYPNAEGMQRVKKCRSVIKTQMSDISPDVGKYLNESNMIADVIPALISILQPGTIRAIPTQLWNNRERETVNEIVKTMIGYNLSYSQEKQPDGTYAFVLEPNIEAIGRFALEGISRPQFPYTVKQLVAREITMEKLRRSDFNSLDEAAAPPPVSRQPETQAVETKKAEPEPAKLTFNRHKSVADIMDKTVKPTIQPKDFFGRPIIRNPAKEKEEQAKKSSGDIWYKFKEGFSNAVRKNLRLKDLI